MSAASESSANRAAPPISPFRLTPGLYVRGLPESRSRANAAGNGSAREAKCISEIGSSGEPKSLGANVFRLRADQTILPVLLDHVGAPAGHAAAGEQRDEALRVEPERLQHQRGVELDVGPEVATRLVLL